MGKSKQVSSPFLTGGGGHIFENNVQTAFAILMLSGAFIPGMPTIPIQKIKLQGKYQGYETDDMIVYFESTSTTQQRKLLIQIKHSAHFTKSNSDFKDFIIAAWNDYNNPKVFEANNGDRIALITGLLSFDDTRYIQDLLQSAKESTNLSDFNIRITKAKFCNKKVKAIYDSIKAIIKSIDKGTGDEQIRGFLCVLDHYIFDLDKRGVNHALLNSIISIATGDNPEQIWSEVHDEIQRKNQWAGMVSRETFSSNLQGKFETKPYRMTYCLSNNVVEQLTDGEISKYQQLSIIYHLALIGSWDEKCDTDRIGIESITGARFSDWLQHIREFSEIVDGVIQIRNGKWELMKIKELWEASANFITISDLRNFKDLCIEVLKTRDPRLDLDKARRMISYVGDYQKSYSPMFRQGIVKAMAVMSCFPDHVRYINPKEVEEVTSSIVFSVIDTKDWKNLAALSDVMEYLAEASPKVFIDKMEEILAKSEIVFKQLIKEEGEGLFRQNYILSVVSSLNILAWDRDYFGRVALFFAKLHETIIDISIKEELFRSLGKLFCPFIIQTNVNIEEKRVILNKLKEQHPELIWKLLLYLLPDNMTFAIQPEKPNFRSWADGLAGQNVKVVDFRTQVELHIDMCLSYLQSDNSRHISFLEHIATLPSKKLEIYLDQLQGLDFTSQESELAYQIWKVIMNLCTKHKKYADADWAFQPETIARFEALAKKLCPSDSIKRYSRLFTPHETDLFEGNENYSDEQAKLAKKRAFALNEVIREHQTEGLIKIIETVDAPNVVGQTLAFMDEDIDNFVFTICLNKEIDRYKQFNKGYIWNKAYKKGWDWLDTSLSVIEDDIDRLKFLLNSPFVDHTWRRVEVKLGNPSEYWKNVYVNPYEYQGAMDEPIKRLLDVQRPFEALLCVHLQVVRGSGINTNLAICALRQLVEFQNKYKSIDIAQIFRIIEALQKDEKIRHEDMIEIEWKYLSGSNVLMRDFKPVFLEKSISASPASFVQLLSKTFLPDDNKQPESKKTYSDNECALNGWRLFFVWSTPPGLNVDGSFNSEVFKQWITEALKLAAERGYTEVAQVCIGQVLFYVPSDPDGFFINMGVADILDMLENCGMRRGFSISALNSSKLQWVPPAGSAERQKSSKYLLRAEQAREKGYVRLAATLREIDESFRNLYNR